MEWVIGIVSGLVSAAIVSYIFYLLSGKQLKTEAKHLRKEATQQRQLTLLMLRAMEAARLIEFNRDESGNPLGIVFKFGAGGKMELTASAPTELRAAKPPEEQG